MMMRLKNVPKKTPETDLSAVVKFNLILRTAIMIRGILSVLVCRHLRSAVNVFIRFSYDFLNVRMCLYSDIQLWKDESNLYLF